MVRKDTKTTTSRKPRVTKTTKKATSVKKPTIKPIKKKIVKKVVKKVVKRKPKTVKPKEKKFTNQTIYALSCFGNDGGAPTKYNKKYCQEMVNFFAIEPYKEITKMSKLGTAYQTIVPNKLPAFIRFSVSIGVSHTTLLNWCKEHKEFDIAYQICKEFTKDIINTNGLLGLYNAQYAQFVAVNCTDMQQKQHVDHTSKDEKINIAVINYADCNKSNGNNEHTNTV